MPLIRKIMEPLAAVSRREERDEDALFLRLRDVAKAPDDSYGCTVQGSDSEFVVVLSDPDSGRELCAWTGSANAIVIEFQHWLEHKAAEAARVRQ